MPKFMNCTTASNICIPSPLVLRTSKNHCLKILSLFVVLVSQKTMNYIFYGTVIIFLYSVLYPTAISCCENASTTSNMDHQEFEAMRKNGVVHKEVADNSLRKKII